MSNRKAVAFIWPKSDSDWRSLRNIAVCVLLAVSFVALLSHHQKGAKEQREREWVSVTAKIEDARPKLVSQGLSQGGGAMLYQVEVRVKYIQNGSLRESWLSVAQFPMLHADAELKALRWKGSTCTVRWKANDANSTIAEAS